MILCHLLTGLTHFEYSKITHKEWVNHQCLVVHFLQTFLLLLNFVFEWLLTLEGNFYTTWTTPDFGCLDFLVNFIFFFVCLFIYMYDRKGEGSWYNKAFFLFSFRLFYKWVFILRRTKMQD